MERSKEFEAFTVLVDRVLVVPHSVIKARVEAQREKAQQNSSRPGPKPKGKVKPSALGRAAKSYS